VKGHLANPSGYLYGVPRPPPYGYYSLGPRPGSVDRCPANRRAGAGRAFLLGISAPDQLGCPSGGAQLGDAPLTGYETPVASGRPDEFAKVSGALGGACDSAPADPRKGLPGRCICHKGSSYSRAYWAAATLPLQAGRAAPRHPILLKRNMWGCQAASHTSSFVRPAQPRRRKFVRRQHP
jgi:hypothetical protein